MHGVANCKIVPNLIQSFFTVGKVVVKLLRPPFAKLFINFNPHFSSYSSCMHNNNDYVFRCMNFLAVCTFVATTYA